MSEWRESGRLSRRQFAALAAAGSASGALLAQDAPPDASVANTVAVPPRPVTGPPPPPFEEQLAFTREDAPARVLPFPPTQVRLTAGPFQDAQEANRGVLQRRPAGRLGPEVRRLPMKVPTFRASGASPSAWIKPASGDALAFQAVGQERNVTLVPFHRRFGERCSSYWQVS